MDAAFEDVSKKEKLLRSATLTKGCYDAKSYEFDDRFRPYNGDGMSVHTTYEMLDYLQRNPETELDAKVIGWKDNKWQSKRIDKTRLFESFQSKVWDEHNFREFDQFANDFFPNSGIGQGTLGQDFTPLLGGPFFKNMYYYTDYIRMHAEAFYAYHFDPLAKAIVQITRDFVIGTGFEVKAKDETEKSKLAMAAWKAFEKANNLSQQIDNICEELSIYGEVMIWKLPNNQDKIIYQLRPGDTIPYGIIPRVRLIDVSNIVEVVTYPEDIQRPLMYVWLTPTQWQMFQYGLGEGRPTDLKNVQPSLKFIYRTIMADQMLHYRINCVSNEKRGRSDFFPILSYLKRLRDIVDYQLVALQKSAAWAIDTEVDGDENDINSYIQDQASLGTVAPAGSEFVHTTKIKRQYIANQGASHINSDVFAIALSMVSAGVQIPVSYFGTHLSGGQTRASALVATEPVAKKMEKRREVIKRILYDLWDYCMEQAGLGSIDCQIIFPELITQDRSAKLKDVMLCEQNRWISPARAAALAAKEMGIDDYSYESEIQDMGSQLPEIPMPLTDPAIQGGSVNPTPQPQPKTNNSGMSSEVKRGIKQDDSRIGY